MNISRQSAIAEIYDEFMTIDGKVHDRTAKKCIDILQKLPSVHNSRNTAIEHRITEAMQKQDAEIKVGYEVYNLDRENKRIVTAIDGDKAIQLCSNGKYTVDNIDTLHWTGREDLRIKKVLEKITNEV